jgi:tellurite resistance protein TehA-like permease
MDGQYSTAIVLLVVSGLAWLALGYVLPWSVVLGNRSRPVLRHADGSWFLWAVAAQSVAVSGASLEPVVPGLQRALAVTAVLSWSVGVFLYGGVAVAVAGRLLLYDLRPAELTPPYWVAMGATAISVLAGARIVEMHPSPMVDATRALVGGLSVLFWAFGTWLIPVLVAAGWWRHRAHRVPLVYRPALWSLVFPLGMYSVAGTALGHVDRLPVIEDVGTVALWVAFAAWLATLLAMLAHLYRVLGGRPEAERQTG